MTKSWKRRRGIVRLIPQYERGGHKYLTSGEQLLQTIQSFVATAISITREWPSLVQSPCHQRPGRCWMWGDEAVNESLFMFFVTGVLSLDPLQLRLWCVYTVTKLLPLIITHDIKKSWEVLWSEIGIWEHKKIEDRNRTREREGGSNYNWVINVHLQCK